MQLLALIRSLDRSRVLPWLILLDGQDDESHRLAPSDCPIVRLGVRSLRSFRAVRAAVRLAHYLKHWRIDIVQTYFIDSTVFGVLVARMAGVSRVFCVRNNLGYWVAGRHRLIERWLRFSVDLMLTNSPAARDSLISRGFRPTRIRVVENGVDLERFTKDLPRFGPTIRVGAVANLRPVKGLDLLIRAASELVRRHPNLMFEVAGEGPQRGELEALIRDSGLGARFVLRGTVADIPEFLAALDIVVLPSRSESLSNALLEAMASGRAIVATRVGAACQLIRDGVDGKLIPSEDVGAMVAAIDEFVRNPQLGPRMGASARERISATHSREMMCRRFERLYVEMMRG
jgi:glycosyltransferase involved in cell wall biosynthesis